MVVDVVCSMKRDPIDEPGAFYQLSSYRKDEKLELKTEISNRSLSQKLQTALDEPVNSGTKEALLSGEHISRLMGRRSATSCH